MAKVKLGKATKEELGYLGGRTVIQLTDVTIAGKPLVRATLADGTSYLMTQKDLEAQLTKKPGDFKHL